MGGISVREREGLPTLASAGTGLGGRGRAGACLSWVAVLQALQPSLRDTRRISRMPRVSVLTKH